MKFAATMLVLVGLASASAASASASAIKTDTDFLRASRCKGLAAGMGVDTASLDSLLKTEARWRQDAVVKMAQDEQDKARRQARDANLKDKLTAELSGPCTAYLGSPKQAS